MANLFLYFVAGIIACLLFLVLDVATGYLPLSTEMMVSLLSSGSRVSRRSLVDYIVGMEERESHGRFSLYYRISIQLLFHCRYDYDDLFSIAGSRCVNAWWKSLGGDARREVYTKQSRDACSDPNIWWLELAVQQRLSVMRKSGLTQCDACSASPGQG